ncbi:putative monooxygenase [Panaeolus papilionaceus]|nr:putative monooxygenase [Panaeolus papilionaceus]
MYMYGWDSNDFTLIIAIICGINERSRVALLPSTLTRVLFLQRISITCRDLSDKGGPIVLICPPAQITPSSGPKPLPVIGNAHQIPQKSGWLVFSDWSKKYGDIIHVDALGQPIIVINSAHVARELLDKRSSIYSDRPVLQMASLCGYDRSFTLLPFGEAWRKQRRLLAQEFTFTNCTQYHELQNEQARLFVQSIFEDPDNLLTQVHLRVGIIIIRTTYGYDVKSADDPILAQPLLALDNFAKTAAPGSFFVDFLPWLKHIPPSFPGTGFLQTAQRWKVILDDSAWVPFNFSKDNLDNGKALMPNFCGNYLMEEGETWDKEDEERLVWAAVTMMGGALETTTSVIMSFVMAMILNPDIQKKAQAELDEVVGRERLPLVSDQPHLPYVRSIIAETLRWAPPLPLGIPHASTQDDEYNGMLIPKGSLIMANIWHMLHDPSIYDEPMKFSPGRYNGKDEEMEKVQDIVFGFGRRVCPGMHFAQSTIFAAAATLLATCDVLPGINENGEEALPKVEFTPDTISRPESFKLRLRSRTDIASVLLSGR